MKSENFYFKSETLIFVLQPFSFSCSSLQGRKMRRWAGWNCGYTKDGNVKFKALCMKENELSLSSNNAGSSFPQVAAFKEIIIAGETPETTVREGAPRSPTLQEVPTEPEPPESRSRQQIS